MRKTREREKKDLQARERERGRIERRKKNEANGRRVKMRSR